MDDLKKNIRDKKKRTEVELKELVENCNAEALLICMMPELLMATTEQNIGDQFGTHPAMLEILAEVCIPLFGQNTTLPILPTVTNYCYELLKRLVHQRMFDSMDGFDAPSALIAQSSVVRGSAYPEQTLNKIRSIQGRYDRWFETQHGISPSRTADIVTALVTRTEELFSSQFETNRNEGEKCKKFYRSLLDKEQKSEKEQSFVDLFPEGKEGDNAAFVYGCIADRNVQAQRELPADLSLLELSPRLEKSEIKAFKKHFCVNRESIGSTKHIQRKTFYELTSGTILFTEISNSSDVIWDKFEELAKLDNQFYSTRYQKVKAQWLESRTYEHLCKIFPPDSIYKNLTYPDPTKDSGNTELDLAVHWGPFLLVIEAKAKQFRFESITGDRGRLRTDIKNNIQDAYDQSLRAISYVEQSDKAVFLEKNTKRQLVLEKNNILKIFSISVTFHHMANLATQLDELKEMGLFVDGRYPFSICESDLELISGVGLTSDAFLHYVSRRLSALSDDAQWCGDELDLFGAYLDCRLLKQNMMEQNEEVLNSISFMGYSEKFDQLMAFNRGEYPDDPEIQLRLPDGISSIFKQLEYWKNDQARWIAFALLDLEDDVLFSIGQALYDLKRNEIEHEGFRRMSYQRGDTVVSVVGSSAANLRELESNMRRRGLVEKYRRKTQKSLVFGVLCNGSVNVFDTAVYFDYQWEEDLEVARLVDSEPAFVPSITPGRNQPCFCGSGMKYKKCCRNKVDQARRMNPQLN